eukprot:Amastigsp_a181542_4.p2 type:complete len:152 gc:universal Amastigsp_a181542_4:1085-630(-)
MLEERLRLKVLEDSVLASPPRELALAQKLQMNTDEGHLKDRVRRRMRAMWPKPVVRNKIGRAEDGLGDAVDQRGVELARAPPKQRYASTAAHIGLVARAHNNPWKERLVARPGVAEECPQLIALQRLEHVHRVRAAGRRHSARKILVRIVP